MGATLGWPAVTVLGFILLTGVVVALGFSSTARYEFEHNGAREAQRAGAQTSSAHPAGRRAARRSAPAPDPRARQRSVDVAVRPAPADAPTPAAAPATGGPGWYLVDESAQALAGPFADRLDADWLALSQGIDAVAVHGVRHGDGTVAPRPSPEERAWLKELSDQLDRLPGEWDALLSDTDPLTTLVVEVAAALVEAGLPLHDAPGPSSAGGVSLLPEPAAGGVVVAWRAHDRMSLQHLRGPAVDATVARSMNAAIAEILGNLGFVVEPHGGTGGALVTALR